MLLPLYSHSCSLLTRQQRSLLYHLLLLLILHSDAHFSLEVMLSLGDGGHLQPAAAAAASVVGSVVGTPSAHFHIAAQNAVHPVMVLLAAILRGRPCEYDLGYDDPCLRHQPSSSPCPVDKTATQVRHQHPSSSPCPVDKTATQVHHQHPSSSPCRVDKTAAQVRHQHPSSSPCPGRRLVLQLSHQHLSLFFPSPTEVRRRV